MGVTCSGSECTCGAEGDDILRRELMPQLDAKFVVDDVSCSHMLRVLRVRPCVKVVWVDGSMKAAAAGTFNPIALIKARQSSDATLVANTCLPSAVASFVHTLCVRPSWDLYFMRMAWLCSTRSNCIKRRVGALLVKDRRVLATGYNGTAAGALNCMDGGCLRCLNADVNAGQNLDDCLCLHAEQNAFLEIGRKHCVGSTLYVTMFPCIGCSKMARQMGVVRLIYSETYDTQTADRIHSFKDAGIVVERVQVGSTVFVATE